MAAASFNGNSAMFGTSGLSMVTVTNPRTDQKNMFFGLNGIEALDGGQHGRFTVVKGRLYGAGKAGISSAKAVWESYFDGNAYVLIDTSLRSWANVKLESFEPEDRISVDNNLGCSCRYSARFLHLS